MVRAFLSVSLLFLAVHVPTADVMAQDYTDDASSPVDLQADSLVHNDNGQSVTARGAVVLKQSGKVVKADEITYFLQEDKVIAEGNVEFTDVNGDKHMSDRVVFNNSLKDGFVEGLTTFLADGSRFIASSGTHTAGNKTVMKDAFYTPCETCKLKPGEEPLWQIRASRVEHDKEKQEVSYHNARFEMKGVPIGYFPYFAHPDSTVKQKSGFLTPSAGYKSDMGAFLTSQYYWAIAPDRDMTFGLTAMSADTPLGMLEWRQRWRDASLMVKGSATYSERRDDINGVEVVQDEEFRGNFVADGIWDMNNKWRSGVKLNVATDDQYIRQYDIEVDRHNNILENEVYVERFSGRNYASGRILAFQDIRIDQDEEEDQPHVLPEIEASFIGEPNNIPLIGGRWSFDASVLGLIRDDDQQDMNRVHTALGWKRRLVSDYGLVSVLDVKGQGTFYNLNDLESSSVNDDSSNEARGFGYVNALTSYPMVREFERSQVVIEPIVSATFAPNIEGDDDIPNEDSQDVQLDSLNVFEADRFPGVDGVEDTSRVTYGLRGGIYKDDGSFGEAFIGQSYNFKDEDNPFSTGSGLEDQDSDLVGQLSGSYKDDYHLDYRFQMDNQNLSAQRHEIDATMEINKLKLQTQYLYAKGLSGTDISETREQIRNSAEYYINDRWRIFGSARHDLGDDAGLRKANVGVDYIGQCISLSLMGNKTLTDDASGDSATEIFLRIGFKNLGEFAASGLEVGGGSE